MNGLVYTLDDDADSTPVYWMGVLLAAFVFHAIPLFFITFKMPPPPVEEPVTVTLDDSFLNMFAAPPETPASKPEIPAPKEIAAVQPAAVPASPVVPPEVPASIVEPPPAVPEKPKPAAPKPSSPAPKPPVAPEKTDVPTAPKKPLHDKELPPLAPKSMTAFDESTDVTKTAPKDAYLSDRNSVAKDRGPKNLPVGDPFLDKGDTNLIKYLQKRGEGNLPPLESEANAGSVKVEGAAVSGDGGGKQAKDFSKNVKTAEVTTPRPQESKVEAPPEKVAPEKKVDVASLPPPLPVKPDLRPTLKPKPQEPDPIPSETGTLPPAQKVKEVAAEPVQLPTEFALDPPKRIKPAEPIRNNATVVAKQPLSDPTVLQPTAIDKAIDQQAELDRFEAQLNGRNSSAANDGFVAGSGAKLRKGQQGHEGNGTTRPGDDNAVSDVTSINLESSATEFGDAQFAKKFDPKTAYIKRFARRIDGKWKADIVAHLRRSLIPGSVSIRIVIRKDGKLLEASEVYRDRGVRDDYVATAKRAVEEAATPNADPFPPALAERDTIEYTFTFLYN